jgi:hypothetical protein
VTRKLSEVHAAAIAHEAARGWGRGYPTSPMIDDDFTVAPRLKLALRAFKRDWLAARGAADAGKARVAAVQRLYSDLAREFDAPVPGVSWEPTDGADSGASAYYPRAHRVVLRGPLSIVTSLHEFFHAMGYGEQGAVWFSCNCFRAVWPRAFARLQQSPGTHFLRRAN